MSMEVIRLRFSLTLLGDKQAGDTTQRLARRLIQKGGRQIGRQGERLAGLTRAGHARRIVPHAHRGQTINVLRGGGPHAALLGIPAAGGSASHAQHFIGG